MYINSRTLATLAEERILVTVFFFRHILYFALIPSEVFFRQIALVGVKAVVPHDAEIMQGHVLHQPGEELTVMQRQFLFYRVSPVRGVLVVTVTERDVPVFHRRDFIFAQACPFGIPPDILYHLFGHFQRWLQMYNPLFLVYHVFDKVHELHTVVEVMFELSVVEQLYQSLVERVFEYASDESVIHL